jgi:hypothetical protein
MCPNGVKIVEMACGCLTQLSTIFWLYYGGFIGKKNHVKNTLLVTSHLQSLSHNV